MFDQHVYIAQKLRELEGGAAPQRRLPRETRSTQPRRRLLGPIAGLAGRQMRHLGQTLEAWGVPDPAAADGGQCRD